MHPRRLSYLAYNHSQRRQIVDRFFTPSGWHLTLSCGHSAECVPHATPGADWSCMRCGEEYVRAAPQFAAEFSAAEGR